MPALAISAALLGMGASLAAVQHVATAQASQYSPLTTTSHADN